MDGWSIWAGTEQMRWVSPGRIYGTPGVTDETRKRIARGGVVAITPTGPFLGATLGDPLVVAIVAQEVLRDLGWSADEIQASGNVPFPPAVPEGAIG